MGGFVVGNEVFYIHNKYPEPPEIREGVIVESLFPNQIDLVYYSLRRIEHKNFRIATFIRREHEVFATKLAAYPAFVETITKRIEKKREELTTLETCLADMREWHTIKEREESNGISD